MISIIPSESRYHANHGWLDTRWHFSFSDYYDANNMNFGPLRVFNDDIIHGGGGFPMHPHRDMEIVTYVIDGQLEHRDHLGNRGIVHPGEVQMMSAGKGIMHAEYNASKSEPVRLIQLWIEPKHRGNKPRWEQRQFSPAQRQGKLLAVISGGDLPDTLHIDQDATIYVGSLLPGQTVEHRLQSGRKAYLFVISGALSVNGQPLNNGDQARVDDELALTIAASGSENAELILLDLP